MTAPGSPSPSLESPTNPAAPASSRVTVVDSILLFVVALGIRLAAIQLGAEPQPVEFPSWSPETSLLGSRLASLAMSSLAPVLLAHAGERFGGRISGLIAGGLLALAPQAVEQATWAGATSPLLLAASAALLCLVAWTEDRRPVALAGFLLCGALVAMPHLGGPLALGSLAALPSAHDPRLASPLLATLRQLLHVAGPLVSGLAATGAILALIGRVPRRSTLPVLGFGALVFGATLIRLGPSTEGLAAVIPAAILLVVIGIMPSAAGSNRTRLIGGRLVVGIAFVIAILGTSERIAAARVPSPATRAAEWIGQFVPERTALLLEAGTVSPARLADVSRAKGLRLVPIPPAAAGSAVERSLFYDPNLAGLVPWMILLDQADDPPLGEEELDGVRRTFHETFRDEWVEAARIDPERSRRPGITILQRPDDWELDREAVSARFSTLAGPVRMQAREESRAFSDWVLSTGVKLRQTGQVRDARFLIDIAHERDPESAETNFQRALVQLLLEDLEGARISLLTGLVDDASHGGIHYNLGTLFEAEGDIAGAAVEYGAAIRYLDDPTPAHGRLGALLVGQGHAEEARQHLDAIRRAAPGSEAERVLTSLLGGA